MAAKTRLSVGATPGARRGSFAGRLKKSGLTRLSAGGTADARRGSFADKTAAPTVTGGPFPWFLDSGSHSGGFSSLGL